MNEQAIRMENQMEKDWRGGGGGKKEEGIRGGQAALHTQQFSFLGPETRWMDTRGNCICRNQ